ncbi:MarR family transcriptional regulator [Mesorhizobium argentiipisi]|uniref:MarR family transcriptional regulator n=1 Tax=Mesorhizobium argentiipisi TaxID=3015175 RepID=A0ABU8KNF5_9HYPH
MEEQLAYLIASVNRQLEEELTESLRPEGISVEQFRILTTLASNDGRSMRDLAELVLVDPATLTKIIDRMVADGLVYRAPDPDDRRKVLIFLSNRGTVLHDKLKGVLRTQQRALVSRLTEKRAEELASLLRGVISF